MPLLVWPVVRFLCYPADDYLRQGGYVIVIVCLSVSNFAQKTSKRICTIFSGKIRNKPLNKWSNFGGDSNHSLNTGIVFRIRHYREIWNVVNGGKSAAHTNSPDGGTCLQEFVHKRCLNDHYLHGQMPKDALSTGQLQCR